MYVHIYIYIYVQCAVRIYTYAVDPYGDRSEGRMSMEHFDFISCTVAAVVKNICAYVCF